MDKTDVINPKTGLPYLRDAKAPRWVDSRQNAVQVQVRLSIQADWMPYCATPDDTNPLGKEIWDLVASGKLGPISTQYVITDEMRYNEAVRKINHVRALKLAQAMAYEQGLFARKVRTAEVQNSLNEVQQFREATMALEEQEGYPFKITPPKEPWR